MNGTRWYRYGRGHGLAFFATDEEIQHWLNTELAASFGPYSLVGADLVKQGRKRYNEIPFRCPCNSLMNCIIGKSPHRWDFFIESSVIKPMIASRDAPFQVAGLSLGGLLNLQHGLRDRNGRIDRSVVGVVRRIENLDTGEIRENGDYMKVFERLRRAIRKSLTYTSLVQLPDGRTIEDNECKMTDAVVEAWNNGLPLSRAPGSRKK